jgi:4-alpha-glucanotransferase
MTGQQHELAELRRLARLYQVQTDYTDLTDRRVEATPDSLLAALNGLGADIAGVPDAGAALRHREHALWNWHLEPVTVAWDGSLPGIELRAPVQDATGEIELELAFEGGGVRSYRWFAAETAVGRRHAVGRVEYVTLRLGMNLQTPPGYHEVRLHAGGREMRSLIISAPRRAYSPEEDKSWGVFLPLYALHSRRSWGIGDFTDLEALVRWASAQGASFVATLPLLASFLDTPFEPSPYMPVSRLFWNEIFIDPEAAVTVLTGGAGEDGVVPAATVEAARRLNAREPVPHREVMTLKRRVLEQLTRLSSQGPAANEAGRGLRVSRPALDDYAAFRAAVERQSPSWRAWPERQRRGSLLPDDYDAPTADYHAFAQAVAGEQVARVSDAARQNGARLYLDLPVGVHPDGYDAWRYQRQFVDHMSVGAPPDLLAPDGQDWGFAPLNPEAQRRAGYEYVRAYLQHHLSVAGILRVDHAIGLHRLFWIPRGASGREGVFVRQHSDELYAILSLESHRHEAVIVGENLGLVPPEVNEGLAEHGVCGMYVQLFEFTGEADQPAKAPPSESIASFSTHDLPTFAAYWTDADLEERRRIGLTDAETEQRTMSERLAEKQALTAHLRRRGLIGDDASEADVYRGATRLLAESDAARVLLNLEDLWGETRAQNLPGTMADQHPNWTQRAKFAQEEFSLLGDITKTMAMMREVRPRSSGEAQGGEGEDEAG